MLTSNQKHIKRVQAAVYSIENPEKTPAQLARKFSMDKEEIKHCVSKHKSGKLVKKLKKHWNHNWDHADVIFHADDNYIQRDIELGVNLNSTLTLGMFEPEYDSINGGSHFYWGEEEVNTLLCSLPYRVLEIIRDSEPGEDDYEEAVLFLDCDLMKAICKREGLDHEYILEQALTITKANI